jgi:hypothetical protein
MGKLLILARYIFLIYGSDIHETRRHVHVTYAHRGHKKSCKFWLEPEITVDTKKQGDFTTQELREIKTLLQEHLHDLNAQLDRFYADQQVTAIRKP